MKKVTLKDLGYELVEKDGKYYYNGDLNLYNTKITTLPDNLIVGGSLNIMVTKIASLPDNLVVEGFLDIRNTDITSLPDNFTVGGDLIISKTNISSLPDNLVVGRSIDISETRITSLPNNLIVSESLYLNRTEISSLPDNLVVGKNVYYKGTNITEEEISKVNHNIPKVLFWKNKEYVKKVNGIFYKVISNRENIYEISLVNDDKICYLITNGDCKYIIKNTLETAKKEYNSLNIKEE